MKNLKLGLFSLLAIFAASIFLTSCEQEEVMTQTTQEVTMEEGAIYLYLPEECNTMSEDELNEYLSNLTPAELSALSSTDNEIEDRGCTSWSNTGQTSCFFYWFTCYGKRTKYYRQVRRCGSPNSPAIYRWKRSYECCWW